MGAEALFEWRSYRYFPYERDFARLEVERLFQSPTREDVAGLRLPTTSFNIAGADRLTYFARAVHSGGHVVVPRQTRLEASAHEDERERQATRYSAHGLHEYKGKFNPQVVRAIGNIMGLRDRATVLDPFCGSGTTLLECAHAGWDAVGIDRNPLATRIANAKLRALRRADGPLQELAAGVVAALHTYGECLVGEERSPEDLDALLGLGWAHELPSRDYLKGWFPLSVLAQVVAIQRVLRSKVASARDRAVFEVVLSDQLRQASLQEPADLRIRRRKRVAANYPLIAWFVGAVSSRIERVVRARRALGDVTGQQHAELADIRTVNWRRVKGVPRSGFDAIITSPPYETALPYIDTQRLSLVLFGDIEGNEVQATERALIGARDVGVTERRQLEAEIIGSTPDVPPSVLDLCRELLEAASRPGNGFRRIARPALVLRYFKSMAAFFLNARRALRSGGRVALVVGTNKTTLGGREYVIDTPSLLIDVGVRAGFTREDAWPMDTYQRYGLHQKNSIDSEMLIVLRAP
jgi:site-specific DNA-methyltransferase (cytosine-N4-specific)